MPLVRNARSKHCSDSRHNYPRWGWIYSSTIDIIIDRLFCYVLLDRLDYILNRTQSPYHYWLYHLDFTTTSLHPHSLFSVYTPPPKCSCGPTLFLSLPEKSTNLSMASRVKTALTKQNTGRIDQPHERLHRTRIDAGEGGGEGKETGTEMKKR